jgi:DNA-binding NarL/FixJ family response regulator
VNAAPTEAGEAAPRITVLLVEDHTLFRAGIRLVLLEAGIDTVGETGTLASALELIELTHPDVVLLDLSLGESDGMPLLQAVRERWPATRVLVVSMHRHAETVRMAFQAGADGYLAKGARSSELVDAIRAVTRGERYVHSSVAGEIIEDSLRWQQSSDILTAREREILRQIASGQRAPEIGRVLGISEHTVRRHIANLGQKVGVQGIRGLRRYAAGLRS